MDYVIKHISFLGKLHQHMACLTEQHKKHTRTLLQWPTPFMMTQNKQEQIQRQQRIQIIPDRAMNILEQIQRELKQLQSFLQNGSV